MARRCPVKVPAAKIEAMIEWAGVVNALDEIIDNTPHLSPSVFSLDDAERLEKIADKIRAALNGARPSMHTALMAFIESIDVTGGVTTDKDGNMVPLADEEWVDLGHAYSVACSALGRLPLEESQAD